MFLPACFLFPLVRKYKCDYSHDLFRGSFKFGFISLAFLVVTLLGILIWRKGYKFPSASLKRSLSRMT